MDPGLDAEGLQAQHKTSISDVVTAADHAAEELVESTLRRLRPDDGIVGEEGAEAPSRSGRTWVIDPVDGTYNFLSGLGTWCSALALRDLPLAEVAMATYLHPAVLPDDSLREPWLAAVSGAATVRMFGSGSCDLAAVAAGRLGVWAQQSVPEWDWLPGAALVTAAGGRAEQVVAALQS